MPTRIEVDIYAQDRASRTFDKVGNSASRSGGLVTKFGSALTGAIMGGALINGVDRLAHGLVGLAEGAADDEQAARRMALQFHNSAGATDAQVAATEAWITAQGAAAGVADDALRPALTKMVTATHDVTEAQKLVSLAMDASAGSGKSLDQVTTALVRGYNGSVTGLGRLNIATKDAAGETLTFDQITKNMAGTFRGQAAEAADTAGGRYARLKVQFSELGEEIGYGLLPVANDFGSWILDEGVPAAQDLTHWVGDELGPAFRDGVAWVKANRDELVDFGGEMRDTVVPAVRGVVDVAGDALGLFMQLPAPVREFAGEAALAAAVMPRLGGAMTAVNLPGFINNLRTAETRTAALGGVARNAAGVGGVLALAQGAGQSNDALQTLSQVGGGALLGFSVGGPIGAAVGGTAGLLLSLATRTDDAAGSMTSAKQPAVDFAASLDQVTGAARDGTRGLVLLSLQQRGVIDEAQTLGISTNDLVSSLLGQKGAQDRVNAALNATSTAAAETTSYFDAYGNKVTIGTEKNRGLVTAAGVLRTALGLTSRELDEDTKGVIAAAAATADWSGKLKGIPTEVKSDIRQNNLDKSLTGVAKLVDQYDLAGKDVVTLLKAANVDKTVADVQKVIDRLAAVHDRDVYLRLHYQTIGNKPKAPLPGGGSERVGAGPLGRVGAGGLLDELLRGGGKGKPGNIGAAGAGLLDDLVKGIRKGRRPLSDILSAIGDEVRERLDLKAQLEAARTDFAGSFTGWKTSLFSMGSTEDAPLSIEALMAQSAANLTQSGQVRSDVNQLIGMGVSKDFLDQLQQQGSQGIETLHLLAGTSAQNIATLNAQNAATIENYQAAGMQAWDRIHGDELAKAQNQAATVVALQDAVRALGDLGGKFEFVLQGNALVAVQKKKDKREGRDGRGNH